MLLLCRKVGERILIGDDVVVTVLAVGRKQVRLGFEGPMDVRFVRQELLADGRREPTILKTPALAAAGD